MYKNLIVITAMLAVTPFSQAFAHDHDGPCKKLIEKCEAAGFKRHGHKDGNNGEFIDCLDKLLKGEQVKNVSATPEEITACQAVKAKRHSK